MSHYAICYVIYDRPTDYPHCFVARRWLVMGDELLPEVPPFAVGPTLDAVRDLLPPGLLRMERQEEDDPNIVETWI